MEERTPDYATKHDATDTKFIQKSREGGREGGREVAKISSVCV